MIRLHLPAGGVDGLERLLAELGFLSFINPLVAVLCQPRILALLPNGHILLRLFGDTAICSPRDELLIPADDAEDVFVMLDRSAQRREILARDIGRRGAVL